MTTTTSRLAARFAAVILTTLLFTGCGGGGGGGGTPPPGGNNPPPANHAPTVTIGEIGSALELSTVTLTATGEDADGDNLAYKWTQTAGPPVDLAGTDTAAATFTFTAPKVKSSEILQFQVTVDDGKEASVSETIDLTVMEAEGIVFVATENEADSQTVYFQHPALPEPLLIHAAEPNANVRNLVVSPNHRWVAFIEDGEDSAAVLIAALDGSGARNLTQNMANPNVHIDALAWIADSNGVIVHADGQHPDISELYFGPVDKNEVTRRISSEIYDSHNNETGDPVPDGVPDGNVDSFSIAPQGHYIAFSGPINGAIDEVFVTTPEGDVQRVSIIGEDADGDGLPAEDFNHPAWSVDGSRLAFTGNPDGQSALLYLANPEDPANTINITGIFDTVGANVSSPTWSPIDNHLMFTGTLNAGQGRELFVVDAAADDPAASRQLISGNVPAGSIAHAQWAPNGELASFVMLGELYVVSALVPGEPTKVSGHIVENGRLFHQDGIAWSPDSKYIAFQGSLRADDELELYVTALSDPANRKLTFDYHDGFACRIDRQEIRWNSKSTHLLNSCFPETGAFEKYLRALPVAAADPSASMINVSGSGIDTNGDGIGDAATNDFVNRPSGDSIVFTARSLDSAGSGPHLYEATIDTAGAPRGLLPSAGMAVNGRFVIVGPEGVVYSDR